MRSSAANPQPKKIRNRRFNRKERKVRKKRTGNIFRQGAKAQRKKKEKMVSELSVLACWREITRVQLRLCPAELFVVNKTN